MHLRIPVATPSAAPRSVDRTRRRGPRATTGPPVAWSACTRTVRRPGRTASQHSGTTQRSGTRNGSPACATSPRSHRTRRSVPSSSEAPSTPVAARPTHTSATRRRRQQRDSRRSIPTEQRAWSCSTRPRSATSGGWTRPSPCCGTHRTTRRRVRLPVCSWRSRCTAPAASTRHCGWRSRPSSRHSPVQPIGAGLRGRAHGHTLRD